MRTNQLLTVAALASLGSGAAGCKWTDFDDLESETWVRSTQDPELGANDYAAAIIGVETGAAGGTLAVISDDTPNYSTLEYAIDGSAEVGTNPAPERLGTQNIGAVADTPIFISDAAGARIALVERSINGGRFAVYLGSPTSPASVDVPSEDVPTPAPDAATFLTGGALVFTAGSTLYRMPQMGASTFCRLVDQESMPVQAAGIGQHGTSLVVWTKDGTVLTYAVTAIETCSNADLPPLAGEITLASFMPAGGARVHVMGNHVVLSGKPATSRVAEVYVVDMTSFSLVGSTLAIDGMRSSLVAELGGASYFVAGIPDKTVKGVVAGAVELYPFDSTTGVIAGSTLTLHDADPESGQLFGRTITTMSFRGERILVAGTATEVFAYFRTAVYDHLP